MDAVCRRFEAPLRNASIDLAQIREEWDDMLSYAKKYLNLVQEDYKVIWWKLFNSVDSQDWSNILGIIELLFSLPMANGRLERLFSQLKLIKSDRRNRLGENSLDQLLRINVEGPPLGDWDATQAVELWLQDKTRRVNQPSQQRSTAQQSTTTENPPDESFLLDDWEEWITTD